jgi:hypothetical protein
VSRSRQPVWSRVLSGGNFPRQPFRRELENRLGPSANRRADASDMAEKALTLYRQKGNLVMANRTRNQLTKLRHATPPTSKTAEADS